MKTLKYLIAATALGVTGFFLGGCGTGVDPIAVAVGNGTIPQLGPISLTGGFAGNLTNGFTSNTPYWTFNFVSFAGNYVAPADGVVAQVGFTTINGTQTNFITLVHTGGRLATRFYGVQSIVVRVGDSVFVGQTIGTFYQANGVYFQVLLDGNPVCPLSFLSSAARQSYTSWTINPCL